MSSVARVTRRVSATRSSRNRSRLAARLADARANPGELRVTYVCPRCGGPHPLAEHDLSPGARGLPADELRRLRQQVAEETLLAVRRHADADVLAQFARLADALDVRLADLDRRDTAGIERRQRVAAETGAKPATIYAS